jgi:hypothetical protein
MDWIAIASGFAVGCIVGLTGVGGGSLMTPLLIGVFRLPAPVAIGTDLWFAAITKTGGTLAHHRLGTVDYRIAGLMLAGSVPASAAVIFWMHASGAGKWSHSTMALALGIALILTAGVLMVRPAWQGLGLRLERMLQGRRRDVATWACGVVLGVLVTLSSVGAGAIGATLIVLLHPRLAAPRVVGTDIAHAVPLTFVAGLGHASLGHVDWALLASLLAGSLPGIWLGARLASALPDRLVRTALCLSLLTAGVKVMG